MKFDLNTVSILNLNDEEYKELKKYLLTLEIDIAADFLIRVMDLEYTLSDDSNNNKKVENFLSDIDLSDIRDFVVKRIQEETKRTEDEENNKPLIDKLMNALSFKNDLETKEWLMYPERYFNEGTKLDIKNEKDLEVVEMSCRKNLENAEKLYFKAKKKVDNYYKDIRRKKLENINKDVWGL
jgi:hypothetical protein